MTLAARRLRGVLGTAPARVDDDRIDAGADPGVEWRLAGEAARRGDYREAIRRGYRSALLEAAGHGRLAVNASQTTRELLAGVRGDADLLAALAPAAAAFDFAWYSGRPSSRTDWDRARALDDAVRSLARRAIRTPAS